MRIEAQCRNFKFWLTLTKYENKLSQIAYNGIKCENKAFWSKQIKSLSEQIGLGEFWMKAHYADPGGGGYCHTLPIWVCAAQRGRDFEAPDLERDIIFRTHESSSTPGDYEEASI